MQTASLSSTLLPSSVPRRLLHQKITNNCSKPNRKRLLVRVFAVRKDANERNFDGRLVGENLLVLRMRIHQMKMAERNYEVPAGWMEWEKRYYTSYDSDICEGLDMLQILLMNTRPGIAFSMLFLVALSVPTTVLVILSHLSDAQGILFGICLH